MQESSVPESRYYRILEFFVGGELRMAGVSAEIGTEHQEMNVYSVKNTLLFNRPLRIQADP